MARLILVLLQSPEKRKKINRTNFKRRSVQERSGAFLLPDREDKKKT